MTSLFNTCAGSRPGYTNSIIIGVFLINAFELLHVHVITEFLVSFFNDGCYRIIYHSILDISRQISILN